VDIRTVLKVILLLPGAFGIAQVASAELSKRNLSVELRQVEERDASGYSAGSTTQSGSSSQWVLVRNGEKANLRISQTMAMQWVQSAAVQSAAPGDASGKLQFGAMGVTSAMVMVESGQSLLVKPQWAGGNAPAVVEIELQTTQLQADSLHPIPQQLRNTLGTVVEAPLGYWVVIATEGQTHTPGTYSSGGGSGGRKSLQIRVQAP
jgi:hypothetical protein